ncbi:MAG TPA: RDD family protein [Polyangia bacterium]
MQNGAEPSGAASILGGAVARPAGGVRVRVAGFWRRAVAAVVDLLVLSVVFVILDMLVSLALRQPLPRLGQLGPDYLVDVAVNGDALALVGLVLLAVLAFLYFFIFQALSGQTPGKRLVGVRVIDAFGDRPSLGRALLRTAAYLPSALLLGIGFLWVGFDPEKRGLHDRLADTYVVSR